MSAPPKPTPRTAASPDRPPLEGSTTSGRSSHLPTLTVRTYPFSRLSATTTTDDPATASSGRPRPFASSARKRESVLALGSIDSLTHMFTKLGRQHVAELEEAHRTHPDGRGKGPKTWAVGLNEVNEGNDGEARSSSRPVERPLPPTPIKPRGPAGRRFPTRLSTAKRIEPDWQGAVRGLRALEQTFRLERPSGLTDTASGEHATAAPPEECVPVDVLDLIKTTATGIRAVRELALAVPNHHLPGAGRRSSASTSSSSGLLPAPDPIRNFSTPSRPVFSNSQHRTAPMAMSRSLSGGGRDATTLDPLARIRRVALDVLAALRSAEEVLRLKPTADGDSDTGNDGPKSTSDNAARDDSSAGARTSGTSPSLSSETSSSPTSPIVRETPPWEDRLGYLYPSDLTFSTSPALKAVKAEVGIFLREVNDVLFGGRGWGSVEDGQPTTAGLGSRNSSTEAESSLATWADKDAAVADRMHSLLAAYLPPNPVHDVPSAGLAALVDGQLLCLAFNAVVWRSSRPFALIPPERIHNILGEVDASKGCQPAPFEVSRTKDREEPVGRRSSADDGSEAAGQQRRAYLFRRVENLREFAAAIKLRFLVPLVPPGSPSAPPGSVIFSASVVAKRVDGWELMLENLLRCWLDRLTEERTEELEHAVKRAID